MIVDLLPALKRKKKQEFRREELKRALLDIGVLVVLFILVFVLLNTSY